MVNEFDQRIKRIEKEILDLKTASEYASMRNTYTTSATLTNGLYQIEYDVQDEDILATAFRAVDAYYCVPSLRTPSGNLQIMELQTKYWDNEQQAYITDSCPVTIISNYPVKSITRIS